MLLEIASLAEEVDVKPSAARDPPWFVCLARAFTSRRVLQVQSLLFDPADSRRLAFHLGAACAPLLLADLADGSSLVSLRLVWRD
jgi:hypothetical protein